jgi:osmotically inducible protein OsmC
MPIRNADVLWQGDLKSGKVRMVVESSAFYSEFNTGMRFQEDPGTNPEELLGAAYAGCFSMALSNLLDGAGFTPKRIRTSAKMHLEKVENGFKIELIELNVQGAVPGIDDETFANYAGEAKDNCPVSQALTGVEKQVTTTVLL